MLVPGKNACGETGDGEDVCEVWLGVDDWDIIWLETKDLGVVQLAWVEDWDKDGLSNEPDGEDWFIEVKKDLLREWVKVLAESWSGDDAREDVWVGEDDCDIARPVNSGFEQLLLDGEYVSDTTSCQGASPLDVADGDDAYGGFDFWNVKMKCWSRRMDSRTSSSLCCRLSRSRDCAW